MAITSPYLRPAFYMHRRRVSLCFALIVLPAPATPSLPAATASTSATTETRIGLRIHDPPIEEQIDRMRLDFVGVGRVVVECVSGALNRGDRCRHTGSGQLIEEIETRRQRHGCVCRTVNEDRRSEGFANVFRRAGGFDHL